MTKAEFDAIYERLDLISVQLDKVVGAFNEVENILESMVDAPVEPPAPTPTPTPTPPNDDDPKIIKLTQSGFVYLYGSPATSYAIAVKKNGTIVKHGAQSISKGTQVTVGNSWMDFLVYGDLILGFDLGQGKWAGAQIYLRGSNVAWREYDPNRIGVLLDDEFEIGGGVITPTPTPTPPPVVTPPIKRTNLPKGYFSDKIVLFQENRGRSNYGIQRAISMHRPEKGGGGNWCIAIWHPWYEPQHGTQNPQWVKASASQRLTWLKQNVDAAKRAGFLGWGCDWEGGLNMADGLEIMAKASQYARGLGLAVMHIPKLGWEHQLGAYKVSQGQMDRFAIDNMDAICFWSPSATADQYTRDAQRIWDAGFGGDIVGLAYAGKGVSDEEDRKVVRQCRGIFNPGNSVAGPLVQYAQSIQR